eukprot:TRINITY_DN5588_c0_g3_i1.p1 TRINITY_DN5588_c0_g3~~TRINITY_DN5588_c0_g3_i1.p1  ORF type:complete len:214 (+),score=36.31 TRINITY_DN5588_c0_g3_i1:65-706(+)
MVRQADIDSLFAKQSDCGNHCLTCGACAIFDFTLYPMMIYVLFFNAPDFLQPPKKEEDARMFLFMKIGMLSAFTMVMCVYQIMFFDLAMQHCSRICRYLVGSPAKTARPTEEMQTWPSSAGQPQPHALRFTNDIAVAPVTDFLPGMVTKGTPEMHQSAATTPQRSAPAVGGSTNISLEVADEAALEEGVFGQSDWKQKTKKKKKEGKRVKFLL